ncbi:hypothetical protein M422DRAFT_266463 [Sphaerobolus stellatus SS14]|uniref:Uncharacterized protein n=1 Tax=Sphaerobolus stellatus (strain SS14) TaxID=990650 RepID=A0A0C9TP85_SPHS4|nr:hypothetical protein M422DRAFT_266463 [Sphaerobolus stellatus SS14]
MVTRVADLHHEKPALLIRSIPREFYIELVEEPNIGPIKDTDGKIDLGESSHSSLSRVQVMDGTKKIFRRFDYVYAFVLTGPRLPRQYLGPIKSPSRVFQGVFQTRRSSPLFKSLPQNLAVKGTMLRIIHHRRNALNLRSTRDADGLIGALVSARFP